VILKDSPAVKSTEAMTEGRTEELTNPKVERISLGHGTEWH
jgi:hypothetical protein